ncbi:DUF2569 domain-containing protein [Allohahella sp. A8]|uniref:DUF2569 domain-containing protein n=1 Tax=Allohahella sp. A8 TaxID=3141461 RepID=UPI003A80408E
MVVLVEKQKSLEGLGGWLVFIALGILVSLINIAATVMPNYLELFIDGSWTQGTTPGTELYHPLWMPIIVGEISTYMLLFLAWSYLAFSFLSRKSCFPKLYILTKLFTLLFILIQSYLYQLVIPGRAFFDIESTTVFLRTLVTTAIWVPYLLKSKRVKATFTRE